jgi:hypothetical protein
MTTEEKLKMSESDRVAYIALAKSERTSARPKFKKLRLHISSLELSGITRLLPSGHSYLAAIFKDTPKRDAAIENINKKPYFKKGAERINIQVAAFGRAKAHNRVVWSIEAGPFSTANSVLLEVQIHINANYPLDFKGKVEVREKRKHGLGTGTFAALFDNAPTTSQFTKRMAKSGGPGSWLISQEPPTLCRFCMKTGHNLFDCQEEGNVEDLSDESSAGKVEGDLIDIEVTDGSKKAEKNKKD